MTSTEQAARPHPRGRWHRLGITPVAVAVVAALVAIGGVTSIIEAERAVTIPIPVPLVKVRTESGGIVRERLIPIGGVPVALDVDERKLLGLLWPDVDVSVGLLALEELPGSPIVPVVQIKRNGLAIARNAPAPPLKIDLTLQLLDAGAGFSNLATITYGYETTEGGLVPPNFRTKLIGPLAGGFIDPLEAVVETPGYSAPLKINAQVVTPGLDAKFSVAANPLPERIHLIEDPRDDGLDFHLDHNGSIPDVKLDATADIRDRGDQRVRHVDAHVERMPQSLDLHHTSVGEHTLIDYSHTSALPRGPDLQAGYRDTKGDGTIVMDAGVKVAGLPNHMTGAVEMIPDDDGGAAIDKFDFKVLGGGEIESLEFLARNYTGPAGPMPEPVLGPDQLVTAATRQMPDGSSRFRAAGRLLGVRAVQLDRQAADNQQIDVVADLGDGEQPLRALVDLDNRGPGGPSDPAKRLRLALDTTVDPLPGGPIHVNYDPARGGGATTLIYDSPQTVDVDVDAVIAEGDTTDACGQSEVTCLKARIEHLPPHIEARVPGKDDTDFKLSHTGTGAPPDVRVEVDRTPVDPNGRSYAKVALDDVPAEVRGRLDITDNDVVRAAEFHACAWDFEDAVCGVGGQFALGRVAFTVRDQPTRVGMPPRPKGAENFVSVISRDPVFGRDDDDHFEVTGRVSDVRTVAFRQRDTDDDGEADGTLGVEVDVGAAGGPFDADVDTAGFMANPEDEDVNLGATKSNINVNVATLPGHFTACVRANDNRKPPAAPEVGSPLLDTLLAACDRTDVLGYDREPDRADDDLQSTPLSVVYDAATPTQVSAKVASTRPDREDGDRQATTELEATVKNVPRKLRTDVITPVAPEGGEAGRKLEFAYDADDGNPATPASDDIVDSIAFELATRRADSFCEDPRANRKAVCVSGELRDLPQNMTVEYDPDPVKADVRLASRRPAGVSEKLSINPDVGGLLPFRLSSVSPDEDPMVLDARVEELTDEIVGKLQSVNLEGEDANASTGPLEEWIDTCSDGDDNDGDDKPDLKDEDCEPDVANFSFDACPGVSDDQLASCAGVRSISFKATNALAGDQLNGPQDPFLVPPSPAPADAAHPVTQNFSFVERGDTFRAIATISKFKRVSLGKLSNNTPSATTKLGAAFGNGDASDKIRAYVDRDTGKETLKLDAIIAEAPQAINVCIRSKIHSGGVRSGPGFGFCDAAPADKKAIEIALVRPAATGRPDIRVDGLELTKGGNAEILRGIPSPDPANPDPALAIENLGDAVQVLAGEDADLQVDGIKKGTGILPDTLATVADRIEFHLQDFNGKLKAGFPRDPLAGTPASAVIASPNYLRVIKARSSSLFEGSVPDLKRIKLTKAMCDAADVRYPPASDFTETYRPEYTCVNAIAAQGKSLDITVRKEDADGEVLSLDDAGISTVPAGANGLMASIAKSPEPAKDSPVCAQHTDAKLPAGCRPPLLSLEAPRGPLQHPLLRGRLALGSKDLVERLGAQGPMDVLSKRAHFDVGFGHDSWDVPGARIKVGLRGEQTALLANLKLEVPQFLDLDPITSYTCAHLGEADRGDCDEPEVRAETNRGYKAKDIRIKLVGSNVGHGERDLDTIGPDGRLSLLLHDYDEAAEVVLTGAPPAPGTMGSVPYDAEVGRQPPPGPYDDGLVIPGYTDLAVFLRNHYDIASSSHAKRQQLFAQVDGRVNHPLDLTVRLLENDQDGAKGENRHGEVVPNQQITARNVPCAGRPACAPYAGESFALPSFRLRAEVLGEGEVPKRRCEQGITPEDNLGFTACLIQVDPVTRWMNVDVNARPSPARDPARSIEAVADTMEQRFDLRGFRNVNDKSVPALFTPQASLRLSDMEVGLKLGIGAPGGLAAASTELSMFGDLIPHITGYATSQSKIGVKATAIHATSVGDPSLPGSGRTEVATDLRGYFRTLLHAEALFGLLSVTAHHDTPENAIGLKFLACDTGDAIGATNVMTVTNGDGTAVAGLDPALNQISPASAVIALVDLVVTHVLCIADTIAGFEHHDQVNVNHPSPRWTEPGHPIPDIGAKPSETPSEALVEQDVGRQDRTISSPLTTCGTIVARKLTISAKLTVGVFGGLVQNRSKARLLGGFPGGPGQIGGSADCGKLILDVEDLVVTGTGSIDASGAAGITDNGGTPASGLGGGAGHVGAGGAAGGGRGSGGGTYGDPDLTEFGSRGRGGSGDVAGGAGGGLIEISALKSIQIDAAPGADKSAILADGEKGADAGADCTLTAAGGGSGGSIRMIANRVTVANDRVVQAFGGDGGAGATGGGGGGGGKVRIDAVIKKVPARLATPSFEPHLATRGGLPGTLGACADGVAGSNGQVLGHDVVRAATVIRVTGAINEDTTNPWVPGHVNLQIQAMQNGGGPIKIWVCHEKLAWGASDPFTNPALDPGPGTGRSARTPGHATSRLAVEHDPTDTDPIPGDECDFYFISEPDAASTDDPDRETYTANVRYPRSGNLTNAYHGFWAFAQDGDQASTQQPLRPKYSPVKVGSDTQTPIIKSTSAKNQRGICTGLGAPGLPEPMCLDVATAIFSMTVSDQGGSGVVKTSCAVDPPANGNLSAYNIPCRPGDEVSVPLGGDGLKVVDVRADDQAGNRGVGGPDKQMTFFVDDKAPAAPTIQLTDLGPQTNGWYKQKPTLTIDASDPAASAGFDYDDEKPITVLIDEGSTTCGAAFGGSVTICEASATGAFVPSTGSHTFKAYATDRMGHRSAVRGTCAGSATPNACTMQVDTAAPDTHFFIGPKHPDGDASYYRTSPLFALSVYDNAGGSGAGPELPLSQTQVKVDDGAWHDYDPADDAANRLGDGAHTVCFYSVDVAGNREASHCSDEILVDTTAPQTSLTVAPAAPGGSNSYYTSAPTLNPSAGELPTLVGVDASGLDPAESEYQLDDDAWKPLAQFQITKNGRHEVRVRAVDRAGNAAAITERVVFLDRTQPQANVGSYPRRANDRGYFRQPRQNWISALDPLDALGGAGSGSDSASYEIAIPPLGPAPFAPYTGTVALGHGPHTFRATARDRAGLVSPAVSQSSKIDLRAPLPTVGLPAPPLVIATPSVVMRWAATDAMTPMTRVSIVVLDANDALVRRFDVTPGGAFAANGGGALTWNARNTAGKLVPIGVYHYRVQATDEAGNTAISTDSTGFTLALVGSLLGG